MESRSCPFCGKPVGLTIDRCPYCREAIPREAAASRSYAAEGRAKIRRGLLYAMLAGIIHYFAGGYSGMNLPFPIPSVVPEYLTPLLFAAGLGMVLYGAYLYLRS